MRLQLLTVLLLFALLVLVACSSMESGSASESFGNQVPADFNWRVFDELNPEIRLAQTLDYFIAINFEWVSKMREETGLTRPQVMNAYAVPYQNGSIVWGANFNASCEGENDPCCSAAEKINADSIGISVKIAQDYLNWSDKMICEMKSSTDYKNYLYKFLLYGRQGEEIKVIDSLMNLVDSTIFYRNYIFSGKETGMAYRECKSDELQVSRVSLVERELAGTRIVCTPSLNSKVTCNSSCVCDYRAYEFCADKTTKPPTLYAIPK
jgi:hypothetical protein